MNLTTITSRTLSGSLTSTRVVLCTALEILPVPLSDALQSAVNRADARSRQVAGQILGDQQRLREAELRRRIALGEEERTETTSARPEAPDPEGKPGTNESGAKRPGAKARSGRGRGRASGAKVASGGKRKLRGREKKHESGIPPFDAERARRTVRHAKPGEAVSGFPEPGGKDPGKISGDREPHHGLSNPAGDPDPTEWPDPYEHRADPRDPPDPDEEPFGEEPHPPTGSLSTSEPHPREDPEAGERQNAPERDRLDD
jgi:hypothetical protein